MISSSSSSTATVATTLSSSPLKSFSIGLAGSPDLAAAKIVAKHIKSIHHEYTFTVHEGLDAISDVVYHLETYDVTTIRAATPMYLMSRKIKSIGNWFCSLHRQITISQNYYKCVYCMYYVSSYTDIYLYSGVKMVLSGEGADEMFGGYLYFHKCPDRIELQKELVRKLKLLYKFDCLRANKATR